MSLKILTCTGQLLCRMFLSLCLPIVPSSLDPGYVSSARISQMLCSSHGDLLDGRYTVSTWPLTGGVNPGHWVKMVPAGFSTESDTSPSLYSAYVL